MNSMCQTLATDPCVGFSLGKGVFIMQVTDCDASGFYRKTQIWLMAVEWLRNETQCECQINSEEADVWHTHRTHSKRSLLEKYVIALSCVYKIPINVVLQIILSGLIIVSHIVYAIMYVIIQ